MERIWIIGASSGIGEALAYCYARRGAVRLILSARDAAKLERVEAASTDPKLDSLATILPLDATDPEQVTNACGHILREHGSINTLIYSAGVSQRSLVKDTSAEVDRRIMELNYFGATAFTRAVLPSMLQRGSGHIVIISSVAGKLGTPLRSSYAASKHALYGYFDCLRAEVHDAGIKISVVAPGFIQTDITLRSLTGDGTPYGRIDEALGHGMPATRCAELIISGIKRGRPEFVIAGRREAAAVYLRRLVPKLFFHLARTFKST